MGLREVFEEHAPAGAARGDGDELEARLAAVVAAGAAAWPGVALEPATFVRHLAQHLPADQDPVQTLPTVNAVDLYLACACAYRIPAALAAFEQRVMPQVAPGLRRMNVPAAAAEDVLQALRLRLFVAEDGRPLRISQYAGRGSLVHWVGVALARLMADFNRGRASDRDHETLSGLWLASGTAGPELDCLKARSTADFEAALRTALASLSPRERTTLRLHYLDGLSIDEIGVLHGVHRATVARWISGSQETLAKHTRQALWQRLRLDAEAAESLLRFVQSRIGESLPALLRAEGTRAVEDS